MQIWIQLSPCFKFQMPYTLNLGCCCCQSLQPCPTLCDPMDCSLPASSIHGIFQARVLEWGAMAFSQTWANFTFSLMILCPFKARSFSKWMPSFLRRLKKEGKEENHVLLQQNRTSKKLYIKHISFQDLSGIRRTFSKTLRHYCPGDLFFFLSEGRKYYLVSSLEYQRMHCLNQLQIKKKKKLLPGESVQFSRSVVSDSLQPHESQHARPPCLSPTPRVHSNSCPSSW